MSPNCLAPLCAPLVVIVVASCGRVEPEMPPAASDAGEGEASSPNACGGAASLTFGGSAASPGAPCGACGAGTLVCADANRLACVGALLSGACPDGSAGTVEAGMDAASGDGGTSSGDGADVGAGGDASDEDGASPDGASPDGEPGDAPGDAPPFDTGPGWQPDEAGLDAETFTGDDGGASVHCLELQTGDLVADPTRPLLYASVTSTAPELGNSVVRIDPATLTVSGTVFVGSNPNALAITDDGAALYVGENGAGSVRRVDLGSGALEAPVSLGTSSLANPLVAGEIRPVPGSDTRYVVARRQQYVVPSSYGFALFDGETQLGVWDGTGDSISFTSPTVLYGFDNEYTGYDLYEFDVTASGFQRLSDAKSVVTGFSTEITSQGGWVFATSGQAVNGANGQAVGVYAASGPVWADPNGADVWFLGATPALLDFDRNTFLLKNSFPLPAASVAWNPANLIGLSPRTFAFRTGASVCLVSLGQ